MKNELGALMLWIDRKLNRNQDVLVTKIDSIQNLFETSSEASASAADILEGKTAFNGTVLMTGIMENQGAKEATLLAGGTYNIPRGYHDGTGRVTATDLASQTQGTAEAGGILSGLKAWVAGKLIDGTLKDRRGVTVTASSVTQDDEYTYLSVPEEACYSASSKVRTTNSNINVDKRKFFLENGRLDTAIAKLLGGAQHNGYIGATTNVDIFSVTLDTSKYTRMCLLYNGTTIGITSNATTVRSSTRGQIGRFCENVFEITENSETTFTINGGAAYFDGWFE